MLLDDLLERNRGFVRSRESRPLPEPAPIRTALIACYDPRLDSLLLPALGLSPSEGIVLRTAGALIHPDGDPLRSLALAVFLFGVTEAYVVGHTSCRMRSLPTAPFIDSFRARGVAREAFGPQDLREWARVFGDLKNSVLGSIRTIASAPMIPTDLWVGGLLLDDATGGLEVVAPPATVGTLRAAAGIAAPIAARADAPTNAELAAPTLPDTPAPSTEPATDLTRELESIRGFVRALETTAGWREDLTNLRQELDRQKSPLARLALVEKFVRRSAGNARGVAAAFQELKKESESTRSSLGAEDLVDLFRRIGRAR